VWPVSGYIAAAALALGVLGGWTVRDWKADSDISAFNDKLEKARAQQEQRYDDLATTYEAQRSASRTNSQKANTRIKEIYRNVPAPPAVCDPPAAALQLLDASIADANTAAATGELGSGLPGIRSKTQTVPRP